MDVPIGRVGTEQHPVETGAADGQRSLDHGRAGGRQSPTEYPAPAGQVVSARVGQLSPRGREAWTSLGQLVGEELRDLEVLAEFGPRSFVAHPNSPVAQSFDLGGEPEAVGVAQGERAERQRLGAGAQRLLPRLPQRVIAVPGEQPAEVGQFNERAAWCPR